MVKRQILIRFGLEHKGYNELGGTSGNFSAQKYKYNRKEYNDAFGLNIYEMDLRQYDPAISRWTVMDPVTHHDFSPYSAFDNNPAFWSDPSGANSVKYNWGSESYDVLDKDGKVVGSFDPGMLGNYLPAIVESINLFFSLNPNDDENSGGNGGGKSSGGKKKSLQQHRDKSVTLDKWISVYKYFSQKDIALERGKDKYGLPLGPMENYRYVINPYDDNIMDMRHVVVVGYGMGEVNGLGAEVVQYIAGLFGKDPTKSAFNEQDKYSNNIGDSFRNYDYSKHGIYMSYDFARRFGEFLKEVYSK